MNNGTLGLSFWLALAGGIVAFGVSEGLGHMGLSGSRAFDTSASA